MPVLDKHIKDESNKIAEESLDRVPQANMHRLPHRILGAIICRGPQGSVQVGTGVLISSDLVLTCAHVLFNKLNHMPFHKF